MRSIATTILGLAVCVALNAQLNIADGGTEELVCGPVTNLTDSNASGGNYGADEYQEITICPGPTGSIVSVSVDTETGGEWDVQSGDFVFVYDGLTSADPLLGAFNTATDPEGWSASATTDNPSGCVTIVFTSDGNSEGTGFILSLSCYLAQQPFEVNIATNEAPDLDPEWDGQVLICPGETVEFTAAGNYPLSGFGYDQSDETSFFEWSFGNGDTVEGLGSNGFNSVSHTYDDQFGYQVWVTVTDVQGVIISNTINVLVSTTPDFSASGTSDSDFCEGEEIWLTGEYADANETISGAGETVGSFYAGGIVAGQTYLPDGNGDSYTTTIDIGSFPPDQLIVNASDIIEICVEMEHSYLGDLQAYLSCPDGTQITLFEGYNNGGGGTYLGDPIDDFGGEGPGEGWEYCFSDAGTMTLMDALAAGETTTTTIEGGQSISPGTYLPEDGFDTFVGCPVNGEWTIEIVDNLNIDDGYIFEWSILFDPLINPNVEDYTPVIIDAWWDDDGTFINTLGDGVYVVPEGSGNHDYTFNVMDNFGCEWDTTITVNVLDPLIPMVDGEAEWGLICGLGIDMTIDNTVEGGNWVWTQGPDENPTIDNDGTGAATIEVDNYGQYVFTYLDNYCELDWIATVEFVAAPFITDSDIGPFCPDQESSLSIIIDGGWETIDWSTGEQDVLGIVVDSSGVYTVTIEGCGEVDMETFEFNTFDCTVIYPNVISPNGDAQNDALNFPNITQFATRDLKVFDRWGVMIEHFPVYNGGWDGGEHPDGTYWYVLTLDGQDAVKSHFTIFRK